jgi:hypothetical protein
MRQRTLFAKRRRTDASPALTANSHVPARPGAAVRLCCEALTANWRVASPTTAIARTSRMSGIYGIGFRANGRHAGKSTKRIMREWIGHFQAVALFAIAPLIVFSILNLIAARALAWYAGIRPADALLYGLSFGGIGIVVGLMVGLSRDSVVGAVIPALLTFLSGFTVYQFGKTSYQRWRPVLPVALFCLMLGTICAAVFGASERNSFVEHTRRYDEWRIQYEKIEIPMRARLLEKQLGLPSEKPKEPAEKK